MSELPPIDIVVSTYNEARHIGCCLEQLLNQDYPADLVTIWLVDGGSTDRTVAKAREWARREPRLRILESPVRRNLPESLNLVRHESSAPLVAKVDAHGYASRSFVSRAVAGLIEDESLACVGGRPVQSGETRFGDALAAARGSRVGVGGSEYTGAASRQHVLTVQCGVYRRAALDAVGWFNPTMEFGEDDELNWRLVRAGYKILLDTSVKFNYLTRSTWSAAFRQYRNYGKARVMVVRRHPEFLRIYHLAPAVLVTTLLVLAMATPVSIVARWAFLLLSAAYLAVLGLESMRLSARRPARATAIMSAFIALHFGYGIGMLAGALAWGRDRLRPPSARRAPAVPGHGL